jgi:hypothetical protein
MPRRADDTRRQLSMGGACRRRWAKAHNGRSLRRTWRHDWAPQARSEARAAVRPACGAEIRGGGAGLPGLGRRNWWHHSCWRWLQEAARTPWTTIHLIFVFSCNDCYFCWEINIGQLQQISCDGRYFYWFHCSKKMQFLFLLPSVAAVLSLFRENRWYGGGRKLKQVISLLLRSCDPTGRAIRAMSSLCFLDAFKVIGGNFPYMGRGLDTTNQPPEAA